MTHRENGLIIRGNALYLPLADNSVDLVVSSPPYHGLRSYRDGGEHYQHQIGSEATPQEFLESLWTVLREVWRVLKPSGSCFINLGDRRAGSGGHNNATISKHGTGASTLMHDGRKNPRPDTPRQVRLRSELEAHVKATRRNAPDRYNQAAFGRPKSKMLLPHRFAIGCEDGLADPEGKGWIVRSDIVWSKLNGLPESVTDRVRDSHEYIMHLTKSPTYYAAVDEIRSPHADHSVRYAAPALGPGRSGYHEAWGGDTGSKHSEGNRPVHSMGSLPGSVWAMASEPLRIPEAVKAHYDLPDHFAAFPTELPRRIILGWSPPAICTACGEGRRPVVGKTANGAPRGQRPTDHYQRARSLVAGGPPGPTDVDVTITGYACSCWPEVPPTRPAVVLDPFSGTGTVVGVAEMLGRKGLGVDLSMDYCRLAKWRTTESGHFHKAAGLKAPEPQIVGQGALL